MVKNRLAGVKRSIVDELRGRGPQDIVALTVSLVVPPLLIKNALNQLEAGKIVQKIVAQDVIFYQPTDRKTRG